MVIYLIKAMFVLFSVRKAQLTYSAMKLLQKKSYLHKISGQLGCVKQNWLQNENSSCRKNPHL